jgi:hypothetical protein
MTAHFVSWNYKQIRNDLNLSSDCRVTSRTCGRTDIMWWPVRCGSSIESRSSKVCRPLENTLLMLASHIHLTHLTIPDNPIPASPILHHSSFFCWVFHNVSFLVKPNTFACLEFTLQNCGLSLYCYYSRDRDQILVWSSAHINQSTSFCPVLSHGLTIS